MGYKSGLSLFLPIIKDLLKTSLEAKQWGLFIIYIVFFINFGIIQLICLLFTGKTVSTYFKHYSQKDKPKAQKVVYSLINAFSEVEIHMIKRLHSVRKEK